MKQPILTALELLKKAKKQKAHPKMIARLESRVSEEAQKIRELFNQSVFGREVLDCCKTGKKLSLP